MSEFIKDNYWTMVNIIESLTESMESLTNSVELLNDEMNDVMDYLKKNNDTVNWCVRQIKDMQDRKTPI